MALKKRRMKRRSLARHGGVVVTTRLYGPVVALIDEVAAKYRTSRADVTRAMLERIAAPALREDPELLIKNEGKSYEL